MPDISILDILFGGLIVTVAAYTITIVIVAVERWLKGDKKWSS
jgi:hypothetical protein